METKGTFTAIEAGRLDKILSNYMPEKSRSYWQHAIEQGKVLVNNRQLGKANQKVKIDDVISWELLAEETLDVVPENIPLDIVYQDEDIAIINKAIGMVVHPAPGHSNGTLVNAIMYHIKDLSAINGVIRPGIVHRIDKDTSGLLIVAKNDTAHLQLAQQLLDKTLGREYIALVHGTITDDSLTIDVPIARHTTDRKKMSVSEYGKTAITHVQVIKRFADYTLVKCQLQTGRTHQIRVHLNYIGHSIVGDPVYTKQQNPFGLEGQFLHAEKLGLIHPRTLEPISFEVPLPQNLQKILTDLEGEE